MPTTITSAGITFNDATTLTSATIPANAVGATQIANGSVTASKLGTNEQKQIAKAWVNFNGTTSPGTIRSSYNVSSVTKNGTGDYTINFATAMADNNYSVVGMSSDYPGTDGYFLCEGNGNTSTIANTRTTGFIRVATATFSAVSDSSSVSLAVFGN